MVETAKAIEVSNLHKRFGPLEVLKGVSLTARQGDVVAIIGGSGSGKSTFLRCINMLELPSAGSVTIHGETIEMKTDRHGGLSPANRGQVQRLRSQLGMVFQNFNLWQHMTVLQNVIEVPVHVLKMPRDKAVEIAESLLRRVGLYEKRDAYPAFLSGGQQQRAAIARALAIQPLVMLFDEPTSALDPELVGEVLAVIGDLAREKRTMILVTHEMKFARDVSSHVVFLHNGMIEEQGPPQQVFGDPQSERLKKFIIAIGAAAFGAAKAQEVKVGFAAEPYPPFTSPDASGKWVGWEVDFMEAICAEATLTCVVTPVAWDGIIPALTSKKIDMIIGSMSITEERLKTIDFSDKYYNTPTGIVGSKSETFDATPEGLKGKVVGVQVSTVHQDYATKYFSEAAEIKEYQTQDEANQDLAAGRIDAIQADAIALDAFLKSEAGWGGVLIKGLLASLQLAVGGYLLGLVIGVAGSFGKLYGGPILRDLLEIYTTFVRAVPELVLILLLYYAGTDAVNRILLLLGFSPVDISGLAAGIFVIGVVQGAYSTEVLRGAIKAIPPGQVEAARAYGMSPLLVLRRVTLPAMLPYALPGLANLWMIATKDTALLAVVGFSELTLVTRQAAGSTKAYMTFYLAAGLLYLLVTLVSNVAIALIERHARRGMPRTG
eukprot:g9895.t1